MAKIIRMQFTECSNYIYATLVNGIIKINGYGKSEIDFCLQRMLDENLLIGHLLYENDIAYYHGVGLSRKGYQVLDVVRNDTVWLLFIQKIGKNENTIPISATVDILKRLSIAYFINKFEL